MTVCLLLEIHNKDVAEILTHNVFVHLFVNQCETWKRIRYHHQQCVMRNGNAILTQHKAVHLSYAFLDVRRWWWYCGPIYDWRRWGGCQLVITVITSASVIAIVNCGIMFNNCVLWNNNVQKLCIIEALWNNIQQLLYVNCKILYNNCVLWNNVH